MFNGDLKKKGLIFLSAARQTKPMVRPYPMKGHWIFYEDAKRSGEELRVPKHSTGPNLQMTIDARRLRFHNAGAE